MQLQSSNPAPSVHLRLYSTTCSMKCHRSLKARWLKFPQSFWINAKIEYPALNIFILLEKSSGLAQKHPFNHSKPFPNYKQTRIVFTERVNRFHGSLVMTLRFLQSFKCTIQWHVIETIMQNFSTIKFPYDDTYFREHFSTHLWKVTSNLQHSDHLIYTPTLLSPIIYSVYKNM